jgi:hypothetical protein
MARVKRVLEADAGPPGVATVFERLQGGDYAGASHPRVFANPSNSSSRPWNTARGVPALYGGWTNMTSGEKDATASGNLPAPR